MSPMMNQTGAYTDYKPGRAGQGDRSETGSALTYILVAIALFAALSFAMSQMGRQGGNLGEETVQIQAGEIMQYANAIHRGVRKMKIEGVAGNEICFDHDAWGHADYNHSGCSVDTNRLFHPDGGSITFQRGEERWYDLTSSVIATVNDPGEWVISARYEITDIGTDGGGANTVAENAEIILATAPIHDQICSRINAMLDYNPATPPAVASGIYDGLTGAKFDGTYSNGSGKIANQGRERCVADGEGFNFYYRVIMPR